MAKESGDDDSLEDQTKEQTPPPAPTSRVVGRPVTDALTTISLHVKAKQQAQAAIDSAVAQARHEGCSWVQIATSLGVSPQGARQKYLARILA